MSYFHHVSPLGSVFCCAIEPTEGKLALSGGQDDVAYLWEISSGNVLLECEGHSVSSRLQILIIASSNRLYAYQDITVSAFYYIHGIKCNHHLSGFCHSSRIQS